MSYRVYYVIGVIGDTTDGFIYWVFLHRRRTLTLGRIE
jgi:hypothetical protein